MRSMILPLVSSAFLVSSSTAHLTARAPPPRTNEANAAAILDPVLECAPYYYPPATNLVPAYPTIWTTADLSNPGISAADRAIFAAIKGIPNTAPRGTRAGDFAGVNYPASDPDCWWTYGKCTTPKIPDIPVDITRCDEPNTWGFTLDDGPNCSHNAYYDYLKTIDQKATLFYVGSNVLDSPLEAQRGLADGHEICAHTWSHPYMTALTNEQVFAELYFSKKAIKDILGVTVQCWRAPCIDVDDRVRFIATALNLATIGWADDTFDWSHSVIGFPAVEQNYRNILGNQTSGTFKSHGTIVLSHELDNGTMALSEEFLPQIRKQFTGGVMPVGVCMNNTMPYLEGNLFVYPNYAQYIAGTRSITLAAPTAATKNLALTIVPGGVTTPTASGPASATGTKSVGSATFASGARSMVATSTSASAAGAAQSATKPASAASAIGVSLSLGLGLMGVSAALA